MLEKLLKTKDEEEEIKAMFRCRSDWKLVYYPRKENVVAHHLAEFALSITSEIVWLEESPTWIQTYILNDQQLLIDHQLLSMKFWFLISKKKKLIHRIFN